MFRLALRQWWNRIESSSRNGRLAGRRDRPRTRLDLECLEDRVLLSLTPHVILDGLSSPSGLVAIGQTLFFAADDGIHGTQLWKTDGTAVGTALLSTTASDPQLLTNVNGTLFFTALVSATDRELWKSDGTADGTILVKDIYPGGTATPQNLTSVQDPQAGTATLFFTAYTPAAGRQLWKSDGTADGTVLVRSGLSFISNLTDVNGTLLFAANDSLWKSDGTSQGTVMVGVGGGIDYLQHFFTNVNGTLYFPATDAVHGRELWKSDGTASGTVMVKDIYQGAESSFPSSLTDVGGTLYFTADDGNHGTELWQSDGTEAGTVLVRDINPGSASSDPFWLTAVNGTLFFTADDGVHGEEPWVVPSVVLGGAQPSSTAGTPINLTGTVQAPDASAVYTFTWSVTKNGNPYTTSSGAAFTFTPTDAATYGVTLTVTDNRGGSASRTATILVTAAAPDHLLFLQQPTDTAAGQTIGPVIIQIVDQFGNVVTSDDSDTVTLSLGSNASGGTLSGTLTLTVVNGVATFSDLSIDLVGDGYTLHATIGGSLSDIDSNVFSIT